MIDICWECPLSDGIPTCDPSRARCPEPPLSAEEQKRVAEFYDAHLAVWLIHPSVPPRPEHTTQQRNERDGNG